MAEEVAYAIAEYIGEDFVFAEVLATAIQAAATIAAVYNVREQQRRAANRQRDDYNASLRDRYTMVRSATEPRQVVLGRQRVSGPVAYIGSYGDNREHLVMAVLLAGHEIDAVEYVYFDDERVTLDGSGNVTAVNRRDIFTLGAASGTFTLSSEPAAGTVAAVVAYGSTQVTLGTSVAGSDVTVTGATAGRTGTLTITYQPAQSPWVVTTTTEAVENIVLDASGNGSVALAATPASSSAYYVVYTPGGANNDDTPLGAYASLVGNVVTVAGAPVTSVTATVTYSVPSSTSRARVLAYLGAAGQAADPDMLAALPGVWTSAHTFTGLAWLRVEFDYDPDAFPGGVPNVSAQIRGAKAYDPRSGLTAWTENPALLMRYVATSPLLGRQTSAAVDDTSIGAAATICDEVVTYTVDTQDHVRALYTAGLVVKSGTRPKDALDDLATAMAGRWVHADGVLRLRAGAYVTPLQTIDDDWLADSASVQLQNGANRADLFNTVTGKLADEQRDYLVLDYPRVESSTYQADDGAELPLDLQLNAVTFAGQAQQLAAVQMRDARQGVRCTLTCNMRAFAVEVFDNVLVTLPRFGWEAKAFEVLEVSFGLEGIALQLKETDASVYALGTTFEASDPAPNTRFPSPLVVPAITGLACASGTNELLRQADGTILTRLKVSWTAVTDQWTVNGGGVEVRYGPAGTPAEQWQGVLAEQGATTIWLTPVQDGAVYLVKARAYNALVRGPWCTAVQHQVVGKTAPPANVAGLAATAIPGGVLVTWTASTEPDYLLTEVRYGASWAAGTLLFHGTAAGFVWPWPAAGSYTVRAKHVDTSGTESTTDATVAITVGNSSLISTPELLPGAAAEVVSASATAVNIVTGSGIPTYSTIRWQDVLTYTFTPDYSGTVLVAATGSATINTPGSGATARYAVLTTMLDSGTLNAAGRIDQIYIDVGFSQRVNTVIAHTREFTVTSGVAVTLTLRAQLLDPTVTTVIDQVTWRVEKIKR